jgi:hypothetical protein
LCPGPEMVGGAALPAYFGMKTTSRPAKGWVRNSLPTLPCHRRNAHMPFALSIFRAFAIRLTDWPVPCHEMPKGRKPEKKELMNLGEEQTTV